MVLVPAGACETDWPMPRASDDEKASMIIIPGWWPSSACLDASLNITPELEMIMRLERSHLPGVASRARSIGLAKASPTMAMVFTRLALDGGEQLLDVEVAGLEGDGAAAAGRGRSAG